MASLCLCCSLLAIPALAADRFWTNNTSGNFTNALNWSPNFVPGPADNANFNQSSFPLVLFTANRTNANAFLNPSNGGIQTSIGTNIWLLTNSFIVAQHPATAATVAQSNGQLIVTNAAQQRSNGYRPKRARHLPVVGRLRNHRSLVRHQRQPGVELNLQPVGGQPDRAGWFLPFYSPTRLSAWAPETWPRP